MILISNDCAWFGIGAAWRLDQERKGEVDVGCRAEGEIRSTISETAPQFSAPLREDQFMESSDYSDRNRSAELS